MASSFDVEAKTRMGFSGVSSAFQTHCDPHRQQPHGGARKPNVMTEVHPVPRPATVSFNDRLELEVCSIDSGATVKVKLNRIGVQHLVDATLEHAGVRSKSYGRTFETTFGAIDISPLPTQVKAAPRVRVGGLKTVRLGRR